MKWRNTVLPVSGVTPNGDRALLPEKASSSGSEASVHPIQPQAASGQNGTAVLSAQAPRPALRLPHKSAYAGGEGLEAILRARDDGQGCCNATDYWPETLFAWQGRSFPIWPMIVYTLYSTMAVCIIIFGVKSYKNSRILQGLTTPLQNVGYALFLLLTFRTQSVYDRWWEGRKQLGSINCATRDIGRYCVSHLREDKDVAEKIIRWTITFVTTVKCTLRREQEVEDFAELRDVLSPEELLELLAAAHKPSYVSWRISTYLAACSRKHRTDGMMAMSPVLVLETAVSTMVAACSACERIKNTPMPYAIIVHLRSFLVLWLAAIPFVFVASLQWLTIGFCVIVGYALLGFESFGVEIESPFGHDFNDLPLDKIAGGIKANLLGALEFLNTTDATGAIVSKQKLTQTRSRRQSVHIDVWGVPEPDPDTDAGQ